MTYAELIEHYGTLEKAAQKIGVTRQAVGNWKRRGIPKINQRLIQHLTRGRLRADEA